MACTDTLILIKILFFPLPPSNIRRCTKLGYRLFLRSNSEGEWKSHESLAASSSSSSDISSSSSSSSSGTTGTSENSKSSTNVQSSGQSSGQSSINNNNQAHTIRGLKCGTKYQVYLLAYNEVGNSDPSESLAFATEGGGE